MRRHAIALALAFGVAGGCHLAGGIEEGKPACRIDGVRNGLEVDVDCGGPCPSCPDGAHCGDHGDCASNACYAACPGPTCEQGKRCQPPDCDDDRTNGNETGVDCGGDDDDCDRCYGGVACRIDNDCAAPQADGNPTCIDGRCVSSCCGDDCGEGCGCTSPDFACCPDTCGTGGLGSFCSDVTGPDCNPPLTCYYDDPRDGECW